MKVLVTGATGFIGNHVARMCLEQGDDVRVMVMPGEDRSPLAGMDVEFVEGNLLDPASLAKCVAGVEGLYHLAALFAVWTRDPTLHFRINVEGANHMMHAAMQAGVTKVVFTSSIAAIGIPREGELANEETMFNAWECGSDYVLSKFMSHHLVLGLIGKGLPATIVCPGLPFGPGDRAPTPTGKLIISILKGEMKNYFDGGICVVDVRDVARGHLLAMQRGRVGEVYLLANKEGNLEQKELARLVGKIAGIADVATKPVPPWVMKAVARAMELWADITKRPPITTYKTSLFAMQRVYVDPAKAINELGMPQTPVATALADAVKWYRDNGYV